MDPVDMTLYQALVDRLEPASPEASASSVTSLGEHTEEHPLSALRRYLSTTSSRFVQGAYEYLLKVDISNFLLSIDVDTLERRLVTTQTDRGLTADLVALLRTFELQGVRGIPQGVPASSSLASLYLSPLDSLLSDRGFAFQRHVDDISVFCRRFSGAREAQEIIEERLYRDGLALAIDKSKILGRCGVASEMKAATAAVDHWAQESRAELELDRPPPQGAVTVATPVPAASEVCARHAELLQAIRTGPYRSGTRSAFRDSYRHLAAIGSHAEMADVPDVLVRFPDLMRPVLRYVVRTAYGDMPFAVEIFRGVLASPSFWREEELLELCQAALRLPEDTTRALAFELARLALEHPSVLVRARALLAWGAHSQPNDFSVADEFMSSTDSRWWMYPVVSIQMKTRVERDHRYSEWSAERREVATLAEGLARRPLPWRVI